MKINSSKTATSDGRMISGPGEMQSLMRLLQLVSPSLPVGGYSYSHGLEWAVEAGWVADEAQVRQWIIELITYAWSRLDVPVLLRAVGAIANEDGGELDKWSRFLQASRESLELHAEDLRLGAALARLLGDLGVVWPDGMGSSRSGLVPVYALAVLRWNIPLQVAAVGYLWMFAENQVTAALKLVPLGQTAGQRILLQLAAPIEAAVTSGLALPDEEIGFATPGLALASALHETQYTRLFRS